MRNLADLFFIAVLAVLFLIDNSFADCVVKYLSNGSLYGGACSASASPSYYGCNEGFSSSFSWKDTDGQTDCAVTIGCQGDNSGSAYCVYGSPVEDAKASGCRMRWKVPVTVCSNECEKLQYECASIGGAWEPSSDGSCGQCCDRQCQCEKSNGHWVNGECVECNDHVDKPDRCNMSWNNGYLTDANGNPGGGGYWQIEIYSCFYDECEESMNCELKSYFPAGSLTCDDFDNDTIPKNPCSAVGHYCTIQCPNNVTINCECDGNCKHAQTRADCACPIQSSDSNPDGQSSDSNPDGQSSDSNPDGQSSSSNPDTQSSSSEEDSPNSSDSPRDTLPNGNVLINYSGVLNQIEYNTGKTANFTKDIAESSSKISKNTSEIAYNTNVSAGYLNSIDKWQSTINFNLQEGLNSVKQSVDVAASAAAEAASATSTQTDTLHRSNELLEQINGSLTDSVDVGDISSWLDSSQAVIDKLSNPDTTILNPDSLKNDTSQFKSKYSSFFLHDVYTRNGCYEFKISKPEQNSKFGRFFSSDIVVNFGNLGGMFDMCAILRGIVRIAGAIFVLLISLLSYRAAFSSGSGD